MHKIVQVWAGSVVVTLAATRSGEALEALRPQPLRIALHAGPGTANAPANPPGTGTSVSPEGP